MIEWACVGQWVCCACGCGVWCCPVMLHHIYAILNHNVDRFLQPEGSLLSAVLDNVYVCVWVGVTVRV